MPKVPTTDPRLLSFSPPDPQQNNKKGLCCALRLAGNFIYELDSSQSPNDYEGYSLTGVAMLLLPLTTTTTLLPAGYPLNNEFMMCSCHASYCSLSYYLQGSHTIHHQQDSIIPPHHHRRHPIIIATTNGGPYGYARWG